MTVFSGVDLNQDDKGTKTATESGDPGDGTTKWFGWGRVAQGGDAAQGASADAAAVDHTSSETVVSLLKGLLRLLRIADEGIAKAEDTPAFSGDAGVMALAVRRDTPGTGIGIDGDYSALSLDATGLLRVTTDGASGGPATIADGADVAQGSTTDAAQTNPATDATLIAFIRGLLTQLSAGTTTALKLEDVAHATGDAGIMPLAIRKDTAAISSGTTGDYEPLQTDDTGRLRTLAKKDPDDDLSVVATTALATNLVVKASAGTLHSIAGYSTTAQFIQVHDAASLPADTAVPELAIPVTAGDFFNIPLPGHVCATGIVVCNSTTGPTKTIGAADTWITAYYE